MRIIDAMATAQDAISARRVFAEPYERDGVIVIPAAVALGGGGGGSGVDPAGQHGEGGGFATMARPVGAYVIKDGHVSWVPALDVNRLVATLGVLAVVYLLRRRPGSASTSIASVRPSPRC